jgi:hypothetical protein
VPVSPGTHAAHGPVKPFKFFVPKLTAPESLFQPAADPEFDCIAYFKGLTFQSVEYDISSPLLMSLAQPGVDDFEVFLPGWNLHEVDTMGSASPIVPVNPQIEDFQFVLPSWQLHDADTNAFTPPPSSYASAEDDFMFGIPGWPMYSDESSGFFPTTPPAQPSVEDDFVQYMSGWQVQYDDVSGFSPGATFLPPTGDEEIFQSQIFPSWFYSAYLLDPESVFVVIPFVPGIAFNRVELGWLDDMAGDNVTLGGFG